VTRKDVASRDYAAITEKASRETAAGISSLCRSHVATRTRGHKAALNLTGIDVGGLRLPRVEVTREETERIRQLLEPTARS
jgi:dihydrodipicolinate synthase/N-acetylneuraminate lyase